MEPKFIATRLLIVLPAVCMMLAGCAQFQHQTSEAEPHGLVKIAPSGNAASPFGLVKKLDGLPVSAGRSYRVKPGFHDVSVETVETVVESSTRASVTLFHAGSDNMPPMSEPPVNVNLSQSGGMTVTGQQPFAGMQPANLNVENRRATTTTHAISFKAGWYYELDGNRVTATPFSKR